MTAATMTAVTTACQVNSRRMSPSTVLTLNGEPGCVSARRLNKPFRLQ